MREGLLLLEEGTGLAFSRLAPALWLGDAIYRKELERWRAPEKKRLTSVTKMPMNEQFSSREKLPIFGGERLTVHSL